MPKKRLTTNGNVFRRTDGCWQSVIWYFDEQGIKRRKVFSSKTKTEAQQKITTYIAQFNEEVRNSDESQKTIKENLTHWLQVFKFPLVERTTYDRLECTAQHQIYEIVAGHRRKYACEQAGLDTMPVLIRNLDRDAATIIMVDSNLQRENILPSERAKAYKMKLEAIKRQGARNDLTSPKISAKLRSDDEIGQQMGVSGDTVRNYISLTNLVPELMQMVDDGKIALSPAYQIAALKPEEQQILVTTIDYEQATSSLSQAQRMKKFSQTGKLNEDSMLAIMSEEKKPEKFSLTFDGDRIRKYFPKSYTPLQMENTIIKLLEAWQRKRQRSQER